MGSRMMHVVIASGIADYYTLKNKDAFLLGALAPDAVSPKESSHFYTGEEIDCSRCIDYAGFLDKYKEHRQSPYILGYYSHLIADDLWLKGFYLPWLRNRMMKDHSLLEAYHEDFRVLNGKLLNYYGLDNLLNHELSMAGAMDLEEVKAEDLKTFLPSLAEDMAVHREQPELPLQVFTFQQILGYMETAVELGILKMQSFIHEDL